MPGPNNVQLAGDFIALAPGGGPFSLRPTAGTEAMTLAGRAEWLQGVVTAKGPDVPDTVVVDTTRVVIAMISPVRVWYDEPEQPDAAPRPYVFVRFSESVVAIIPPEPPHREG
jgi:hypothetical protein